MALGIPFQGVIGGITVLTQLNPYVVALHLVLSMILISLAVWLVRKTRRLAPAPAAAGGDHGPAGVRADLGRGLARHHGDREWSARR